MLSIVKYDELKRKYGQYSSFALWHDSTKHKADKIDDLSIFGHCLAKLNTKYVFVSLNPAKHNQKQAKYPDWHSFHSGYRYSKDYILRELFKGTKASGAYLTDLYCLDEQFNPMIETDSKKAISGSNQTIQEINLKQLNDQLSIINDDTTLIGFGAYTYKMLIKWQKQNKLVSNVQGIYKLTHYSAYNKTFKAKKLEFDTLLKTI